MSGKAGRPKGGIPWNKGKHFSPEVIEKMRIAQKGKIPWNKGLVGSCSGNKNAFFGRRHTEESKQKMRDSAARKFSSMTEEQRKNYGQGWKGKFGPAHIRYKIDRSSLKKKELRNDPAYWGWRRDVNRRDDYKCRISNIDCNGRIEVHHILSWREFPELRYNVNNGITLCQFHHPRKRNEEKRLIPVFQGLVSVSSG